MAAFAWLAFRILSATTVDDIESSSVSVDHLPVLL
jgi:hypothetical protein